MIQRLFLFAFLLSSLANPAIAQKASTEVWKTMSLMKFERQFAEQESVGRRQGRFIPVIEAMDCQDVYITGYVIPLDGKKAQKHFMFSAYPYAGCFFCGKAGAETVIEVYTKEGEMVEFSDLSITLKGTFYFTGRDPNDIMFTLEEAEKVEE